MIIDDVGWLLSTLAQASGAMLILVATFAPRVARDLKNEAQNGGRAARIQFRTFKYSSAAMLVFLASTLSVAVFELRVGTPNKMLVAAATVIFVASVALLLLASLLALLYPTQD